MSLFIYYFYHGSITIVLPYHRAREKEYREVLYRLYHIQCILYMSNTIYYVQYCVKYI